jgi:hypothetical protein
VLQYHKSSVNLQRAAGGPQRQPEALLILVGGEAV